MTGVDLTVTNLGAAEELAFSDRQEVIIVQRHPKDARQPETIQDKQRRLQELARLHCRNYGKAVCQAEFTITNKEVYVVSGPINCNKCGIGPQQPPVVAEA